LALSVLQKIKIAKVSQYLATIDILTSDLYANGQDLNLPQKIFDTRKDVEYVYNYTPTEPTLEATSNYLYALCSPYNLKAQQILAAGGGGSISSYDPTGYVYTVLSFIVTQTNLNDGNPVHNTNVWSNPVFIGAKELLYILVDNVPESIVAGDFTFDKVLGKFARVNPYINDGINFNTIVVAFLRKL
jgi:hypothetical protein